MAACLWPWAKGPEAVQPGPRRKLDQPALGLLIVVTLVLAGWALRAMQPVLLPVVFSIFLALMIAPIDRGVKRLTAGRMQWLGHLAAMAVLAFGLALFIGAIWISAQQFLVRFPAQEAQQAVQQLSGESGSASSEAVSAAADAAVEQALQATPGDATPGQSTDQAASDGAAQTGSDGQGSGLVTQLRGMVDSGALGGMLVERASGLATTIVSMVSGLVLALVLIFFLTLLMLVEAPRWQAKLAAVVRPDACDEVMRTTSVVATKLRRYLAVRLVLGLLTGALYAGWLAIFEVDLLLVWALLAFVLNFVPSIGSMISGALAVIYVFATRDPWTGVLVGLGITAIEQVMGNWVDPRVQGRHLSISALVILVSLLLWGWIWGVAGAVLAVPITVTIMVVCAHVPALRSFALALSGEDDFAALEDLTGVSSEAQAG